MTREAIASRLAQLLTYERAEFAKQDLIGKGGAWRATEWIREERLRLVKVSEALKGRS